MGLMEEEEHPKEFPKADFENLDMITCLFLHMLKSHFVTGRHAILDSGFCVLKSLVELRKCGLFASALIKKWHFWRSLVPD
jgi:hypothetical protein